MSKLIYMKIVVIGDFDGEIPRLKNINCDFILSTGDLCSADLRIRSSSGERVLEYLNGLKKPIYTVNGNHDFFQKTDESYGDFLKRCYWRYKNIHYLKNQKIDLGEYELVGLALSTPNLDEKYKFFEACEKTILLSHYYPRSILEENEPALVIYGHTHKEEIKKIGKTVVVNPGEAKKNYALIDLNNGIDAKIVYL